MERVREDGVWSLICPNECQTLANVCGDQFNELYKQLEDEEPIVSNFRRKNLGRHSNLSDRNGNTLFVV